MRPANKRYIVGPVELINAALPEEIPRAPGRNRPRLNFIRVAPHQIAHGSGVGNLLFAFNASDIVEVQSVGRKSSVNAEYLVVDGGGQGQVVENVSAIFPYV